jgi:flagellar protein FliS
MSYAALRQRYVADSVTTASPARLVVMLYDRLLLDLHRAETALRDGRRRDAEEPLRHAQEIVLELRTSLDIEVWDGAAGLASLYTWVFSELVQAVVGGDAERVLACRSAVAPLRQAWVEAAVDLVATADAPTGVPLAPATP